MKKILFILLVFICFTPTLVGQVSFGVQAGIQSAYFPDKYFYLDRVERPDDLLLKLGNEKYGFHFGGFTRLKLGSVFFQPQVQFNSDNIAYTLRELAREDIPEKLFSERYYSLTVPVKIGLKRSVFTLHTGPVANYRLKSISQLWKEKGFSQEWERLTWSWMVGIGLDLWIVRMDISLEQGLGRYGDGIEFEGASFQFDKNPGRIVSSMYIAL